MPELSARRGWACAYWSISSGPRWSGGVFFKQARMATDERGLTRISKNKHKRGERRMGLLGFDGQVFCFTEEEEAGHQDGEGDQGEQDATSVMQVARKESRVHVSAEKPKRHNPHRVGEHGNGNRQDAQAELRLDGFQEHVGHQKTGDEQSPGGMDGTAFLGDLNPY